MPPSAAFGTLVGVLAVQSGGTCTSMITLAIASAFFYLLGQSHGVFSGYSGFNPVLPPPLFGFYWRGPKAFSSLTPGCAVLSFAAVVDVSLRPFGLANERFKTLIGLGFLLVVFVLSDGVLGAWERRRIPLKGGCA